MKVLIDTNVILDVLCKRKQFYENSLNIFRLCEIKKVEGYISSLSVANIIYIMRKELDNNLINILIKNLFSIFNIIDLTSLDLIKATEINCNDYEDALQIIEASKLKADYIITRNTKDFLKSKVVAITPKDFLEELFTSNRN